MKPLVLFLIGLCLTSVASANVMYWQVPETMVSGGSADQYLNKHLTDSLNTYITVIRYGTGEDVTSYSEYDDTGIVGGDRIVVDFSDIANPEAQSYYIEILHNDGDGKSTSVARSQTERYTDLAKYIVGDAMTDIPLISIQAWTGSGYTVPEPTSALMVMFGVAFLGLKRRKV